MSARVVVTLTLCLSVTRLQTTHGGSIAVGKLAKQNKGVEGFLARHTLDARFSKSGSITRNENPSWWQVDLRGYFKVSNITLTAPDNGWASHMSDASVEVMDKNVSLCSDAQVQWCGNVSSTVAQKEKFTFTCNATFPIRFVRVTRFLTSLSIGHVDVQGVGGTKRYQSYYATTMNTMVTKPSVTTSAVTAGECGILCHRNHSCIDFSYSKTAPTESNCLLTYEVVPENSEANNAWTMYTMDSCL